MSTNLIVSMQPFVAKRLNTGRLFLLQDGGTARPSVEQTEHKLLEVSQKARERARRGDQDCAHITALNAAAAAEEARGRGRG